MPGEKKNTFRLHHGFLIFSTIPLEEEAADTSETWSPLHQTTPRGSSKCQPYTNHKWHTPVKPIYWLAWHEGTLLLKSSVFRVITRRKGVWNRRLESIYWSHLPLGPAGSPKTCAKPITPHSNLEDERIHFTRCRNLRSRIPSHSDVLNNDVDHPMGHSAHTTMSSKPASHSGHQGISCYLNHTAHRQCLHFQTTARRLTSSHHKSFAYNPFSDHTMSHLHLHLEFHSKAYSLLHKYPT